MRSRQRWARAGACAILTALVTAGAAPAAEVALLGGVLARVTLAPARGALRAQFRDETGLAALGDPRCPARSALRLATRADGFAQVPLDCSRWRAARGGYAYDDRDGGGPVRRLRLIGGDLDVSLNGPALAGLAGPAQFLEVALTVGETRACGRFTGLRRNASRRITATAGTSPCAPPRPNVILIQLDDTRFDGIDRMPVLQERLVGEGATFPNAFVPDPICCPSRASTLTGRHASKHLTRALVLPLGGAAMFRLSGSDQQTIAVWLRQAGYRTGLFGKYLNAYGGTESKLGPGGTFYVPPGWDRWQAMSGGEHYGGVLGTTYRLVDEHGQVATYDRHDDDSQYSTDLLAGAVRDFVSDSLARGRNFLAVYTPYASHGDTPTLQPAPAIRHAGLFDGLAPWRPVSFMEADRSDKPLWLRALPLPSPIGVAVGDLTRRRAYETLLSVDEQLALMLAHLELWGVADDTVIILTSDNGATWGEHNYFGQGKGCPYEEAIRVPLLLRYPRRLGTASVEIDAAALNIDLAPTLAALAGVAVPAGLDGASLVPWLDGATPPWRDDFLIEYWRSDRRGWLTWTAQPSDGDRLALQYGTGWPAPRALQRYEFDLGDGVSPGAIAVPIGADPVATYAALGTAVATTVPAVTIAHQLASRRLFVNDTSAEQHGVYFLEEVDQGGAFEPAAPIPDWAGVRDLAGQFTYAEYETGERELYDLTADPHQLTNVAGDPAYAAQQTRLAARLLELRGEP